MILVSFFPQNRHNPVEILSMTSFSEIEPTDGDLESAIEADFWDTALEFCFSVVVGGVLWLDLD